MPFLMSVLGGGAGSGGNNVRGINLTDPNNDPNSKAARDFALQAQGQQQAFANQLGTFNGAQNQQNVFQQQQQVANQLAEETGGGGPNPAKAMLANQTGANAAQQAALMGSQRGTSANAGLIARQAAMQGGALQQQSVGQAAAMQAQQQLAAQQQLMQQQSMMGQVAGNQIGQQQQALGSLNQVAQNQQQIQGQNLSNFNNANISASGVQSNAQTAGANMNNQAIGSVLSGAGSAIGLAHGGYASNGPVSKMGQYCNNMKSGGHVPGQASVKGNDPKNDTQLARLSPGEGVIDRETLADKGEVGKKARFVMAYINKRNRK